MDRKGVNLKGNLYEGTNIKGGRKEGFRQEWCKKLRKEGYTPGVIYGPRYEAKGIQTKTRELNRILMQQGFQGTVNLEIDGQIVPAIIKEVQNDMMSRNVVHVDFQHLSQDEK